MPGAIHDINDAGLTCSCFECRIKRQAGTIAFLEGKNRSLKAHNRLLWILMNAFALAFFSLAWALALGGK